jgi:hypothetical protein
LWEDLDPVDWLVRKLLHGVWMTPETWLVSRQLTEEAGPWHEGLARDQDGEYFSRVVLQSDRVQFVPDAFVFKRVGIADSVSAAISASDIKRESTLEALQLYVDRLVAAENSVRTRTACLAALNKWSFYFLPERPDLFQALEELACSIGGKLDRPRLSPKVRIVQNIFGWSAAKKTQVVGRHVRERVRAAMEQLLCWISKGAD